MDIVTPIIILFPTSYYPIFVFSFGYVKKYGI